MTPAITYAAAHAARTAWGLHSGLSAVRAGIYSQGGLRVWRERRARQSAWGAW
jgi:hypothetical protein